MLDDGGSDVPLGCVSVSSVVGKRENGEASHQKPGQEARRSECAAKAKDEVGFARLAQTLFLPSSASSALPQQVFSWLSAWSRQVLVGLRTDAVPGTLTE